MKTFTLNPTPQTEAFLAEKRKDPVTGETFKEGDQIVFCASCKSAFLKGSWEYMGGQHCGQSETLEVFPEALMSQSSLYLYSPPDNRLILSLDAVSGTPKPGISYVSLGVSTSFTAFLLFIFGVVGSNSAALISAFALAAFIALLVRFRSKKEDVPKYQFRQSNVLIEEKAIPYHEIAECRVSYGKEYIAKSEKLPFLSIIGRGKVHVFNHLKLELFFHAQERSEIIILPLTTKGKTQREYLTRLLAISKKLRLVFSPYTFTEEDDRFIEQQATETDNTYYTESLFDGYF